jgi:hypothetical protein
MNREFVPYEIALELKQLGFQARCLGYYWENLFYFKTTFHHPATMPNSPESCLAPTYSQAFRWFREKFKLHGEPFSQKRPSNNFMYAFKISDTDIMQDGYKTHEQAELECLKKLIEIVKQNENNKIHQ